ncbi:uncharacterized protein N7487_003481 [Penicillium crustosum]|uniref:uncharacterized protein n=1 Tax=Penicillium crustosum TaxID=36656 RepID=UPI0023915798|nr:uncharacterized protein N7487_003481 [Penicillium crustosum]KAJ5419931.1 hypothetical protein N7487_003481 [Penicillium crustosum]
MPYDSYNNWYSYKNCEPTSKSTLTDCQGNHYCSRDYGSDVSNSNCYHYSNQDGSYYYSNPDGSRHYNSGNGDAVYTLPPAPAERYQESDNYGK